jgi:hypothetical protein
MLEISARKIMLNQPVTSCPKCGATLNKTPTTNQPWRCDYCGAELAAKSAPVAESASTLPSEFAGLERPKASNSSMSGLFTLLFAIPWTLCILLSFFIFGAHFLNEVITYIRLSNESMTAQGTVMRMVVDNSGDSTTYNVSYRFIALVNGEHATLENTDSISESVYNKLKIGGNVDVIYVKSDPKTSAIKADWSLPDLWALAFVSILEFIGLAFGLWMLKIGITAASNYLNLRSKGEETQAIVFDCWEESGSDSSSYYIAYAYQVPGFGKQVFTNAEQSMQAYRKLNIGDTISLRYLPDNPKIAKLTGFHW